MTRTNIAKAMLNSLLAEHFENVFYRQGFSSNYPRCIYEIKRTNRENGINDYILTLDVYDKNTSDGIDSMLDDFENSAEQFMYSTDKSYLKIYTVGAERTQITDEDKNICHTQVKYNMKIID